GRDVPPVRPHARLRRGPQTALPGRPSGADAPTARVGSPRASHDTEIHAGRACRLRGRHGPPEPARPAGTTRETTLTMSVYREFTGKTVEEALRAAREEFGVGMNDLDFEILTPGSRGVLGMGAEPAR